MLFQTPELSPVSQILILFTLLIIFYVLGTMDMTVRQTDMINLRSKEAYNSGGHTDNCTNKHTKNYKL